MLNGSGREGKFRLKYATNFELLALLCGQAHTHTPRGSPSFYTKRKNNQNKFIFMVNDANGHSGPGPWKSWWETHQTNRMTHIISSLYWKGSTLNTPPRHQQRGKSTWPKWLDCLSCLKRKNRHICRMLRHVNKIFS